MKYSSAFYKQVLFQSFYFKLSCVTQGVTFLQLFAKMIRAAESLAIFKKRLKTHLFHLYLTL